MCMCGVCCLVVCVLCCVLCCLLLVWDMCCVVQLCAVLGLFEKVVLFVFVVFG